MPGATSMSTIVISTSLRLWANYVVLYHTGNNDITATGIVSLPILGITILREEHLILQHYRIRWSCGRLIMKGWHETNAAITRRRGLTDWIRSIRSRIQNTQPGGTRRQGLTFTGVSFFRTGSVPHNNAQNPRSSHQGFPGPSKIAKSSLKS